MFLDLHILDDTGRVVKRTATATAPKLQSREREQHISAELTHTQNRAQDTMGKQEGEVISGCSGQGNWSWMLKGLRADWLWSRDGHPGGKKSHIQMPC